MKKLLMLIAMLVLIGSVQMQAQGLMGRLKDKAKKALVDKAKKTVKNKAENAALDKLNKNDTGRKVLGLIGDDDAEGAVESYDAANESTLLRRDDVSSNASSNSSAANKDDTPAVPQASDVIPKRQTSTVVWDGVVTPSKASTAKALLAELPPLPSAEKMARSTMDERDTYHQQIAAVTLRVAELQYAEKECSDAEMEAYRKRMEAKIADAMGLTKEEMDKLNDPNTPDAVREKIQQKWMQNAFGLKNSTMNAIQKLESMSDEERTQYIQNHPEFIQEMQKMAENANAFSEKMGNVAKGAQTMEQELAELSKKMMNSELSELNHNYDALAVKYNSKLQTIYNQIFKTQDQQKVDALYAEADELLYNYRLEAAREYRVSLSRRINASNQYVSEYTRIIKKGIDSGDVPACVQGRSDLNGVTYVANVLDEAYSSLPELTASPVEEQTLYELPAGWAFSSWECRGYVDTGSAISLSGNSGISCKFPLLAQNDKTGEHGVLECGKFRKISESELNKLNKQADARAQRTDKTQATPPYGTYKSRSGKRTVEYSKSGELIINAMTTYVPIAFSAQTDKLEWVIISDGKVVKCLYKL